MRRAIRWTILAACLLAAGAALAVAVGAWNADRKRDRVVALPPRPPFALPEATPAAMARGRYLYATRGCADCHGDNGAGRVFIDDPDHGMRVKAPALSGPGSPAARYTAADFDATIRHGVKPDGRPVFIMPSDDYNRLTDADLGALALYMRQLPPGPGTALEATLPLPVRVLYGLGAIRDAAEKIDHTLPPATPVAEGETVAHGRYVAAMSPAATARDCPAAAFPAHRRTGRPPPT